MAEQPTVERLGPESYDEWNALVARSEQRCLFSTTGWLAGLSEASGEEFGVVGCRIGDKLVGGATFHVRRLGGFLAARTHPLAPFGGLVLARDDGAGRLFKEDELHEITSEIARSLSNFARAELIHVPEMVDVRIFQWRGWTTAVRFTTMIDVSDVEQAISRVSKSMRRQAAKTEKAGYVVEVVDDDALLGEFARNYEAVYTRQGLRAPLAADTLSRWCRRLIDQESGCLFRARDEKGAFACATLVVWDSRRAYWLLGATDPERRGRGGNALLHLAMLRELGRRFDQIDVVGANTPHVARYKRAYHGRLTPYFLTEHTGSPILKGLTSARELWQWMRRDRGGS